MGGLPDGPDESRSTELVLRLRAGDTSAFEELYRRYHDELLLVVRARLSRRLRAALESEDILQSVALEAFRELARFEPRGAGSLKRFLHTLIVNKIRDRADTFGAAKRAGTIALDDAVGQSLAARVEPLSYHDPAYAALERALAALPPAMREIIVLRRIDGLSSQEAAARLRKSDAAARKLYSRALARLATLLGVRGGVHER